MRVDATCPDIRKTGINLLPDVNAIHKIVPSRSIGQSSDKSDGFRLNVPAFGGSLRHKINVATR